MKNCILIPCYVGHVKYVEKLLHSLHKFSNTTVDVFVVISKCEWDIFKYLINVIPNNKINLNILFLREVLNHQLNIDIDENVLLENKGSGTFQSLKKILSINYVTNRLDYDNVYLLDSEGIFIRQFNLDEEITEFLSTKQVFYCTKQTPHSNAHISNGHSLLNMYEKAPGYLLEGYYWIFEKHIVNDFCTRLFGDIHNSADFLNKFPNYCFIEPIYYYFIYVNNDKHGYGYNFIDSYKALSEYIEVTQLNDILFNKMQPYYLIEDMRLAFDFMETTTNITNFYNRYKIKNFKIFANHKNIEFLKNTESIFIINSGDFPIEFDPILAFESIQTPSEEQCALPPVPAPTVSQHTESSSSQTPSVPHMTHSGRYSLSDSLRQVSHNAYTRQS